MGKLREEIKEISKIKLTNFKKIENEELVTNLILLACENFIEEENFELPLKPNLNGLQNIITICINALDEDINLLKSINYMLKIKNKDNKFSFYFEELIDEIDENDNNNYWHLILTKTFIKIKLFSDLKRD